MDHHREAQAFGRRTEAILSRSYWLAVWRNFVKWRRENRPRDGTPAMKIGLAEERWRWRWILSRRLFPARERLTETARRIYDRTLTLEGPPFRRAQAY